MAQDTSSRDVAHDVKQEFWLALARSPILMLKLDGGGEHAIPMTAQLDEALGPQHGGAIWFFTAKDNRLAPGGPAMAQFVSLDHHLFACLSGRLVPEQDTRLIDRFWSSGVAAWYQKGRDDPHLLMLRMDIDDVEIWTADMSFKGWFKLMMGRELDAGEIGHHVHEAL